MEILFDETEWHGIKLREVARENWHEVPGGMFYDTFYKTLLDRKGLENLDPQWLNQQRHISQWIEMRFLNPMRQRLGTQLRILSLGVGLGLVEMRWLEDNYKVDLQECQKSSLEPVARRFPNTTIYICDAMKIPCPSTSYDFIVMNALDYVFDRDTYRSVLREASRLLKPQGNLLGVSVSNLGPKTLVKNLLSKIKRGILNKPLRRPDQSVQWGWLRTLSEHLQAGRHAGLEAETAFVSNLTNFELTPLKIPPLLWRFYWPNVRTVAIHWEKKG